MSGRTVVLDRHAELNLAVGYAKKLAETGSNPDIDMQLLLPEGAVKHAKELINYSYGHQILKAYAEVLSSFNRFDEELRVNNATIANKAKDATKNLVNVSGYVNSTIALVDEMFQNYEKIEPGEKKDVGTLRSRFETTKEKAMQLSKDYDNALSSDTGKVFGYGQTLSGIMTSATPESFWDVNVRLTHSVDDLMFKAFDDGMRKDALYGSFVDSIVSSLVEKGARQVSEKL